MFWVLELGFGSLLYSKAFLLQLQQKPGQSAQRDPGLVLLALLESYNRGMSGHLHHLSAIMPQRKLYFETEGG